MYSSHQVQGNRPLRDIVAKLLYYCYNERLLGPDREEKKQNLRFQGHEYQLLMDLAHSSIAKRCTMKSHLEVLRQHNVA